MDWDHRTDIDSKDREPPLTVTQTPSQILLNLLVLLIILLNDKFYVKAISKGGTVA